MLKRHCVIKNINQHRYMNATNKKIHLLLTLLHTLTLSGVIRTSSIFSMLIRRKRAGRFWRTSIWTSLSLTAFSSKLVDTNTMWQ